MELLKNINILQKTQVLLFGGLILVLTACAKVSYEPKPGEYGQQLIGSYDLTLEEIEALNNTTMPKPDIDKRPKLSIGYEATAANNPYRFVMVARGYAIADGEVELRFIGGNERMSRNGYHPEAFREDDTHNYKANEPVLLVLASDPFSVDATQDTSDSSFATHAEITERSNFQFQSVQLQVWEGKGSKYSWTRYLAIMAIFLSIFIFILTRTNLIADVLSRK